MKASLLTCVNVRLHLRGMNIDKLSKEIFLCEPADGGGCRVYACTSCKRLCRKGNNSDKKPRYVQCDPASLDLYDGIDDENEYSSFGIGDKQPSVYANLSCNDRMTLGVLKVKPCFP